MDSNSALLLGILIWIFLILVSMVSLLGNGFITVVLGHQWFQNRKILPCDFLLTTLSTSRFMRELMISVSYVLYFVTSETYVDSYRMAVLYVTWFFFNIASLWSATWLSVFYCVKITNFVNCIFLWLKPRIDMLAPRLLGMSIIMSIIFSLPSAVGYLGDKKSSNVTGTLPGSANQSETFFNEISFIFFPVYITYISINVSISTTASILLLTSLWKHTRNLKKSGVGDKDLRAQVHINVITPMLFYVFFYLLYCSSIIIFVSDVNKFGSTKTLVLDLLSTTFPFSHSIILILTNPKLKKKAAHILNIRQRAS